MAPDQAEILATLLEHWESAIARGESPKVTDICRDHPTLLPHFERLLHDLNGGRRMLGSTGDEGTQRLTSAIMWSPAQQPDELGRFGEHRVLKELGKGGMGAVFLAEDVKLRRKVALKVMLPHCAADPEAKERFLREARAAAAVKHDNVVTIYQVGETNGCPFIVMEFLQGVPLDRWLAENKRPSLPQILRIARESAEGLAAAHDLGMVHRDIKPSNLWLEAPKGRIKILDFGLARAEKEEKDLTGSGQVMGTPAYMSPEQARGERVDARSDLFSLGCVLYRLCTGNPPFRGKTAMALLTALAVDVPPPIAPQNPDVPPALESLVFAMLEKDPARRPPTGVKVVEALQAIERQLQAHAQAKYVTTIPVAAAAEVNPWQDLTEAAEPPVAEPTESPSPPLRSRRPLIMAVAATLVVLAIASALILGGSSKATVRLDSPVAGASIVLIAEDGKESVLASESRMPAGRYRVRLGDNVKGVELATEEVTLERGRTVVVELRRAAASVTPKPKPIQVEPKLLPPKPGPVDDAWIAYVQSLKPYDQVAAVTAKLKELNPGFDGKLLGFETENNVVRFISFVTDRVKDISPLRGLPELKRIHCKSMGDGSGLLADLATLRYLNPIEVQVEGNQIEQLRVFEVGSVKRLVLDHNPMLKWIDGLRSSNLESLYARHLPIWDLRPLERVPLQYLNVQGSPVRDFTPCARMPLDHIEFDYSPGIRVEPLRRNPTLRLINKMEAAKFWAMHDEQVRLFDDWLKQTAALGTTQQIAAVTKKLKERNPEFRGKLDPFVEGGAVRRLWLDVYGIADLSPLRVFLQLDSLQIRARPDGVLYLEPLADLKKLTNLSISGTWVHDLEPLRNLRLTSANFASSQITSLDPLRDHPLRDLNIHRTSIRDLSPLKGKQINVLNILDSPIEEVALLREMPLKHLQIDYWHQRGDRELLGSIASLETINGKPAAAFLKEADDFETWVKETAAIKDPMARVDAVDAKLRELHPSQGIDRKKIEIEGDAVVAVNAAGLEDVRPYRALPRLKRLNIGEYGIRAPWPAVNLRGLAGLKLSRLGPASMRVVVLSQLKGMPLEDLSIGRVAFGDLTPLKGMRLEKLNLGGSDVTDLSPLAGMPLRSLHIDATEVADLRPVKDCPIDHLFCSNSRVRDFSPCANMPLREVHLSYIPGETNIEPLHGIPTLKTINRKSAAQFWAGVDLADNPVNDAWVKRVSAMRATEQIEAVREKLKRLNREFDGQFRTVKAGEIVVEVELQTKKTADLSPLRAFAGLKSIRANSGGGPLDGPVWDLSFVRGMKNLTQLEIASNRITDLTPLAGLSLESLNVHGNPVEDLSPLGNLPLERIFLGHTKVRDLSPLRGKKLREVVLSGTAVTDLSLLEDAPLQSIRLPGPWRPEWDFLRRMRILQSINGLSAAEFWKSLEKDAKP